jgi:uncharacterized protein YqeY
MAAKGAAMNLRDEFGAALKDAVRSQNKRRMSTLRLINAAVKDRDIAARTAGVDEGVSDDVILEILAKMVRQREESVRTYEEAGRTDLAQQESEEIEIIREFLPKQLGEDEVRAACDEVIEEIGASSLKEMGRCMALLKERYAGRMDFARASAMVKERLK